MTVADLDISGSVTRTDLGLGDLTLNTDDLKITEWGPGIVSWRRQKVSSAYVHGDFATSLVKEQVESPLGIRATGSSMTDCWNKIGTLIEAFSQFSYTLAVVIEGTTFTYECEAADYSTGDGGLFQKFHAMAYKQEIKFLIPRRPNPTTGPA